jgi:hypothetical protein
VILGRLRNAAWPDVVLGGLAAGTVGGSLVFVVVHFWPEAWW